MSSGEGRASIPSNSNDETPPNSPTPTQTPPSSSSSSISRKAFGGLQLNEMCVAENYPIISCTPLPDEDDDDNDDEGNAGDGENVENNFNDSYAMGDFNASYSSFCERPRSSRSRRSMHDETTTTMSDDEESVTVVASTNTTTLNEDGPVAAEALPIGLRSLLYADVENDTGYFGFYQEVLNIRPLPPSNDTSASATRSRKRRKQCFICCCVADLLVFLVLITLFLIRSKNNANLDIQQKPPLTDHDQERSDLFGAWPIPSPGPTPLPTSSPAPTSWDRFHALLDLIESFALDHDELSSDEVQQYLLAFSLTDTPQNKALHWLASIDPNPLDLETTPLPIIIERYVMVLFYFQTQGPSRWEENRNFLSQKSVCDWNIEKINGVVCDNDDRVYELQFADNGLKGVIPTEIGWLDHLGVIQFGWNNIQGTLPSQLGRLTNLRRLLLRGNEIVGTIPSEIGHLTNLQQISFESNNMKGTLPTELGNLNELVFLRATNNNFTGTVPTELKQISRLTSIGLYKNDLTGTLDPIFCYEDRYYPIYDLLADCLGDDPKIKCTCCDYCCDHTGEYCSYK